MSVTFVPEVVLEKVTLVEDAAPELNPVSVPLNVP